MMKNDKIIQLVLKVNGVEETHAFENVTDISSLEMKEIVEAVQDLKNKLSNRVKLMTRTPAVNIFYRQDSHDARIKDSDAWVVAYLDFVSQGGQQRDLNIKKLGKQHRCWTGIQNKNWVWDFPNYTVMVSKQGVEFDVDEGATPEEAWSYWDEYIEKLGLMKKERL